MRFTRSFCWLIFLCLYSCKSTSSIGTLSDEKIPTTIHLQKLVCLNLSEKLAGMGTLNDEVSFIVLSLNEDQEFHSIFQIPITKIEKEGTEIPIEYSIDISDQFFFAFYLILVEMDTERAIDAILPIIKNGLSQQESDTNLKDQLSKKLQDDDILGIKKITPNDLSFFNQNELKFWGLQFFDEYDYRLHYSVQYKTK